VIGWDVWRVQEHAARAIDAKRLLAAQLEEMGHDRWVNYPGHGARDVLDYTRRLGLRPTSKGWAL
jgi:hypothetical protein